MTVSTQTANGVEDHGGAVADTMAAARTAVASFATSQATIAAVPNYPAALTAAPVTLRSIVSDVLSWMGLGSLAAYSPIPAFPVGDLLQNVWLGVRRDQYTLFNSYPGATPQNVQNRLTGVITGNLNAYDADGDTLTYDVTDGPEHGTLHFAAGAYTYTPDASLAAYGGTDSFTVTIDDTIGNPSHIHGFGDVLTALGVTSGVTTKTVTLNVAQFGNVVGAPVSGGGYGYLTHVVSSDGTRTVHLGSADGITTVTVIDTADGRIVGTPAQITGNGFATVLSRDGAFAYVTAIDDGQTTVTKIATGNGTVLGTTAAFAGQPDYYAATISEDGSRLVVSTVVYDAGTGTYSGAVTVIDTASASIVGTAALADRPIGSPVLTRDGTRALQTTTAPSPTGELSTIVTVIDTTDGSVIGTSSAIQGQLGSFLEISPDGTRTVTSTYSFDPVTFAATSFATVIDTADGSIVGSPVTMTDPPSGPVLYVGDTSRAVMATYSGLTILDTADGSVVATNPASGSVSPNADHTLVAVTRSDNGLDRSTVSIVDTATGMTISSVTVDGVDWNGSRAVFTSDGEHVIKTTGNLNLDTTFVNVIRIADGVVVGTATLDGGPNGSSVLSPDGVHAIQSTFQWTYPGGGVETTARVYVLKIADAAVTGGPITILGNFGTPEFGPDGSFAIVGGDSNTIYPAAPLASLYFLKFRPDGTVTVGPPIALAGGQIGETTFTPDGTHVVVSTYVYDGNTYLSNTVTVINPNPNLAEPSPTVATPVTLRSIVSDLLSWTGFGSLSAGIAIPDLPIPGILATLWQGVQTVHYGLLNSYPGATPTVGPQDAHGTITGTLGGYDADGDRLTYAVVGAPEHGTVTLVDGVFTYTPNTAFALDGGTDTFTVSIDDTAGNPWHVHGFGDVLSTLGITGPATKTITVTVTPVNPGTPVNPVVVATIPLGSPGGVALSADGVTAYVTNRLAGTLSVIDTATNTVTDTIPVGNFPTNAVLTPGGARLYVVNSGDDTVSVMDVASHVVTTTVPVGSLPSAVAVSPDGAHVYVANSNGTTVSVVDTATNLVTGTITVGNFPSGLAVSPDGARLYVTNFGSGTVSVVDATTNTVTDTVDAGANPAAIAISPDGAHLYVVNQTDGTVSVVDTATNTVTETITVGAFPVAVAMSGAGSHVFVTSASGDFTAIDVTTNTVTDSIALGGNSINLAVSADGTRAYVTSTTNFPNGAVSVIALTPTAVSV